MRQTIQVEKLVEFGNALLKLDDSCPVPSMSSKEYKEGVCDMIEKVLKESGRYAGYMLLGNTSFQYCLKAVIETNKPMCIFFPLTYKAYPSRPWYPYQEFSYLILIMCVFMVLKSN